MSPNTAAALLQIGQFVRNARTEGMHCTEAEFARKIGCTIPELQSLETGNPATPIGVAFAALNALQVLQAVVDAAKTDSFILAHKPVEWPDNALDT